MWKIWENGEECLMRSSQLVRFANIIRVIKLRTMRLMEHVARMGEMRNACNILVRKPEGKRPLGRPSHRWEDNIRMDLREIERKILAGFIWLKVGTSFFEPGNEPAGSHKTRVIS
jgi:hypothetical protein